MEDELKKKLELLIAYAKGADIESILLNTDDDEAEDTIAILNEVIEILER